MANSGAERETVAQEVIPQTAPVVKSGHTLSEAAGAFLSGAKAFERGDLAVARRDFVRACSLDPANQRYRLSAEIARQYMVTGLVREAQGWNGSGGESRIPPALAEALRLDPDNPMVTQYLKSSETDHGARFAEDLRKQIEANAPVHLSPAVVRRSFRLRESERDVIAAVLNAFGIQASFDQSVGIQEVPFNATDVDFSEAVTLLRLATNTLLVPIEPREALVVRDTRENRTRYERQVMETISFSGLTPAEMNDMERDARTNEHCAPIGSGDGGQRSGADGESTAGDCFHLGQYAQHSSERRRLLDERRRASAP